VACWLAALVEGWPLWRWMAGAAPLRLRGMVSLRGPARLVSPARACAFGISCACPAGGAGGWLAVLPTAGAVRRPADRLTDTPTRRHADTPPPSEPPDLTSCRRSADLPPRPLAAPVCRSAAGQAGAAAEGIYRARYRPRIS